MIIRPIDIARFEAKYIPEPNTGCWLWTASAVKGYGHIRIQGKLIYAHRFSYMIKHDLPDDVILDHRCRVTLCVNDEHLCPGTQHDNLFANGSLAIVKAEAEQTHCLNGHPFDDDNTYWYNGMRHCRECRRRRNREWRSR